jgi:ketosteroid isomerase-like protein
MADHPNVEIFRRGYTAFQSGDLDTVRSLFAPDIVWTWPGHNRFSGAHHGADDVLSAFGQQFQETNGTLRVDVHDIVANDEHAVALATVSAERNGEKVSDRYVHVVHIKDGRVTESWIFNEKPEVLDEFWG